MRQGLRQETSVALVGAERVQGPSAVDLARVVECTEIALDDFDQGWRYARMEIEAYADDLAAQGYGALALVVKQVAGFIRPLGW